MSVSPEATKVWQVIPRDGIGGVEVAARSMLKRQGLNCHFNLLLLAGSGVEEELPGLIASPYRWALNPLAQLRAVRHLKRAAPDVIICSLWQSVPAAVMARLLLPRTRLVFFLHSELVTHFADRILSRIAIWRADAVWSDSATTAEKRRLPPGKPRLVISFVTEKLAPVSPTGLHPRPSFVAWARLSREKALDQSIRFIADLRAEGIEATYDIWGPDAGALRELASLVETLGLERQVQFRGLAMREALPAIAAGHSFCLQLSRFEGMAMSVVEAMQLGLVPVTTAAGEMKRYVVPNETGIIVDPARPREAIASIRRLLDDPNEYGRLRFNALERWKGEVTYSDAVCAAAAALVAGDVSPSLGVNAHPGPC